MITESIGATRPAEVEVAPPQVWVRRGIREDVAERASAEGGAEEAAFWTWSEVSFVDPSVTQAYAEEHADELWAAHEHDGLSVEEMVAMRLEAYDEALAELGDIVAGMVEQ